MLKVCWQNTEHLLQIFCGMVVDGESFFEHLLRCGGSVGEKLEMRQRTALPTCVPLWHTGHPGAGRKAGPELNAACTLLLLEHWV